MRFYLIIILFLSLLGSLAAQNFRGKLNPFPEVSNRNSDEIKILAVMVEFQEDNDPTTFGTGKFGSIYSGDNLTSNEILDPLPHNREYFENHLKFAKNYIEKVSGGIQKVSFNVLDGIITVDKIMREYSPAPGTSELDNIITLTEEVWEKADAQFGGVIDFSKYNLFAIFHAGVGRDISLPGSIGNERDIPSVYLSQKALKNKLGDDFQGFSASGKNNIINNTMILPSTESREIESIAGKYLLEISTNGLIVASIGSYLGLPDLFNTETGLSAIGKFGLMDGQSIFAFSGTFPPEPSAWEKLFLGWESYTEYRINDVEISVIESSSGTLNFTTIAKIPINSTEYYLIENRQRDINDDGAIITYTIDGLENTLILPDKNIDYNLDTLKGVITDIDDFDWALPGNGILIWHIDESVIDANLETNSINNDKNRKGIDLEEADGIQDIGEEFYTIFGDVVIGEGTDQDFWFSENPAELYENKFDFNSKPNTTSNDGSNSLISITDFSSNGNIMSFNLAFGTDYLNLLHSKEFVIQSEFADFQSLSGGKFNGFLVRIDDILIIIDSSGAELQRFNNLSNTIPATFYVNENLFVVSLYNDEINILKKGKDDNLFSLEKIPSLTQFVSEPLVISTQEGFEVIAGTESGQIFKLKGIETGIYESEFESGVDLSEPVFRIAAVDNYFAALSRYEFADSFGNLINFGNELIDIAVAKIENDLYSIILVGNNRFEIIKNGVLYSSFSVSNETFEKFIISIDKENELPLIVTASDNKLISRNISGAVVFDFESENTLNTNTGIVTADFNGDGYSEIIFSDISGNLYAIDLLERKILQNFPVKLSSKLKTNLVLGNLGNNKYLFPVITEDNSLGVYEVSANSAGTNWVSANGNNFNSRVIIKNNILRTEKELLPEEQAYNWPNPVYNDETFIRFYVSENAEYTIKIFDLAGDLAEEITGNALGGTENETAWNVKEVQSGVYFASLEVTGISGKTSTKIIKIAVIK